MKDVMAFEPEQKFENPDGSPIVLNEDYFGNPASDQSVVGPFARIVDEMML